MAELADALDSGSSEHYAHRGSSPLPRTKKEQANIRLLFFCFKMYLAGEAETDTSRRPDESDFWKSSSKEASLAGPVKKGPLIEVHYKL